MKKITALLLIIALCFAGATHSYAAEAGEKEPTPTRMWGSGTYYVPAGSTISTGNFYVGDPHFAFEMSALTASGGTSSSTYRVVLKYGSATKASFTAAINGTNYKFDCISTHSDTYHFEITNNSSTAINVTLTYYSWP